MIQQNVEVWGGGVPACGGGWNEMILEVFSNPNQSMIDPMRKSLFKVEFLMEPIWFFHTGLMSWGQHTPNIHAHFVDSEAAPAKNGYLSWLQDENSQNSFISTSLVEKGDCKMENH